MKISELTTGQGNVDVEGTLSEVGEPKVFTKFGRELKVSNAILKDDSGNIKLTLWNEDVSKFNEGDTVKITNGYVNEFQGEPQLTAGKFGKMEKVGEGETSLSDDTAETMAEDAAEDADVEEAVKEEAPEETSEEQIEEASEELEEAAEESEEPEEKPEESEAEESEEPEEKPEESEEAAEESEEPEEKPEESEAEESQEDF